MVWMSAAGLILVGSPAVAAVCTVGNGSLAFGSLLGFAPTTTLNGSGTFSVTCTVSAPYTIALEKGLGPNINSRLMKLSGGSATISYQLYQDAGHSTVFGDGTTGSAKGGVGTGAAQLIDVFGQIASQNVAAVGVYSDSITVTAIF
jgi:spore coat protein U domain-containing protein, fimbrial subunit CupE1/2/3/6